MFRLLLSFATSACREQTLLPDELTFRTVKANAGDSICFTNLPPYTSVVFDRLPISQFAASSSINQTKTSLIGPKETVGFDSGAAFADLKITAESTGTFSYFVVHYPPDCSERILSTHPTDILKRDDSPGKVCFFNGAGRRVTYRIFVSAGPNGLLESTPLNLAIQNDGAESLVSVQPSVISWENMKSVGIQVQADGTHFGFSQTLGLKEPSFIESANELWNLRRFDSLWGLLSGRTRSKLALRDAEIDFHWHHVGHYSAAMDILMIAIHGVQAAIWVAGFGALCYLVAMKWRGPEDGSQGQASDTTGPDTI
jgi:hypothetical protein